MVITVKVQDKNRKRELKVFCCNCLNGNCGEPLMVVYFCMIHVAHLYFNERLTKKKLG